jgi:hypothetical protein
MSSGGRGSQDPQSIFEGKRAALWEAFAERAGLDELWGLLSDVGASLGSDLVGGAIGEVLLICLV